nr:hypothetical protein [Bradyrhizobium sp. 2S1]
MVPFEIDSVLPDRLTVLSDGFWVLYCSPVRSMNWPGLKFAIVLVNALPLSAALSIFSVPAMPVVNEILPAPAAPAAVSHTVPE